MSRKHSEHNRHRDKHARGQNRKPGAHWIYGRHPVVAALENPGRHILRLVATPDMAAEIARIEENRQVPLIIEKMERAAIDRLLEPGAVHQGIAAQVAPLAEPDLEDIASGADLVVVLDQVVDPHNVGAILRSCAAFGVAAVIMQDRHSPPETGTLAKSASGALEWVPLLRVTNLARAMEALKTMGFWIAGLDGDADQILGHFPIPTPLALVMGAEGEGLRRLTREACDHLLAIPSQRSGLSLNVSNAAAAALYEARRGLVPAPQAD